MRVRIVLYDSGTWIVAKFAQRLREELTALAVDVDVAQKADPAADINHHLVYIDFPGPAGPADTLMVTHVDDVASFRLLKRHLERGATGICFSSDTTNRLVRMGLPAARLCYVLPGHDPVLRPRPLLIGLASRVYPDGRKRAEWLVELCKRIRPEEFRFVIIGSGWEKIVDAMRARSFSVEYHPQFDPAVYVHTMQSLDYYLYLSIDEGSMGFVDAAAAGVPTIATPQGFHLDAPDALTHPFSTVDELVTVFDSIAAPRRKRTESVATWTWSSYAKEHLAIWNAIRSGEPIATGQADPARASLGRMAFGAELLRGSIHRRSLELRRKFHRKPERDS